MKKLHCNRSFLLLGATILFSHHPATAQKDSVPSVPVVKLHYFNINNNQQYLIVDSKLKKGKQFSPNGFKTYSLYLDTARTENLIGTVKTDEEGMAKTFLPPALKTAWDAKALHVFILKEGDEELISDYSISKSKLEIDTSSSDGARSMMVKVSKMDNGNWIPAKDVELKVGYKRLGSILSAGESDTYTTDSTGSVTVDVKKDSLPGDEKGNIILAAKADDNDQLGSLVIEKAVPWGRVTTMDKSFFDKRTLWTTRNRTPFWLLFMAYSIVLSVWGTLIYLILQIMKIKKLGASPKS
jgi:hypothetical protein